MRIHQTNIGFNSITPKTEATKLISPLAYLVCLGVIMTGLNSSMTSLSNCLITQQYPVISKIKGVIVCISHLKLDYP